MLTLYRLKGLPSLDTLHLEVLGPTEFDLKSEWRSFPRKNGDSDADHINAFITHLMTVHGFNSIQKEIVNLEG